MSAAEVIEDTSDLEVSFVSLVNDGVSRMRRLDTGNVLNYIESREENQLGFIVCAHAFDVWFQDFYYMFAVLAVTVVSKGLIVEIVINSPLLILGQ